MNLSAVFQHLDELLARKAWGEAEEFLKKNLEEAEPDSQAKLTLTNELTELYRRSGKPDAAIPTAEEALFMARRMGYAEAGLYATLLNNAASAYQDAKDYEHALARYQDVLDFYTKKNMGASFEAAGIHEAISRVAQAQEQYETALDHQQKALDILELRHREDPQDIRYGAALAELADLFYRARQYENAVPAYEKALEEIVRVNGEDEFYRITKQNMLLALAASRL